MKLLKPSGYRPENRGAGADAAGRGRLRSVMLKTAAYLILLVSLFAARADFASYDGKMVCVDAARLSGIDKSMEEYSFAVLGDNRNSTIFDEIIDAVNKEKDNFVISLGDLTSHARKTELRFFLDQAKRLDAPLFAVAGNHDMGQPAAEPWYSNMDAMNYSFAVGSACFIMFDDVSPGGLNEAGLTWLESELAKSQSCRYRFVFMHIPLYDPRNGKNEIGHSLQDRPLIEKINELFDSYHVSMVFTGHVHGYFRGYWGKTPYIITGGAGGRLSGDDPEHFFFHHVRVHVSKKGLNFNIVKADVSLIQRLYNKTHGVWLYAHSLLIRHFLLAVAGLTVIFLAWMRNDLDRRGGTGDNPG